LQSSMNSAFLIFPNVNAAGRRLVEQGNYCFRTNPKGVDLNRNWADHWEPSSQNEDTNPGQSAFSEPETRLLRDYATDFRPTQFYTIHSGAIGMFSPYAFSDTLPGDFDQRPLGILKSISSQYCGCEAGAAGKELGYLCPGTSLDYMYDKLGTRFAFAFEVWDESGWKEDKLKQDESSFLAVLSPEPRPHRIKSCFLQSPDPLEAQESLQESEFGDDEHELAGSAVTGHSSAITSFPPPINHHSRDCLQLFNPTTPEDYKGTVENWSQALLEAIAKANTVAKEEPQEK